MADISQTPANVLASSAASPQRRAIAGATITAGMPIYLDAAASNVAKPADADALASAAAVGIAINGAASGQPVSYVTEDPDFSPGGTTLIGVVYCVSTNAGAICPITDLAAGDYVTPLGVGKASNKLHLDPIVSSSAISG